ncbi:MAG: voltage-gated potassium channel [Phycisphaerales bacterium]|nr:voltage-gated potassium channel [Phycisphaerales bacterium]
MSAIKSIRDDLNYGLAAFGVKIPETFSVDDWAQKLTEKPAQNTAAMLSAATVLFYLAERGHNPKVRDLYDAAVYCSTNISVGYCDIFAQTPAGKMIGSALMAIGPAMAPRTLDGARPPGAGTQEEILATLRDILGKLPPRA